MLSHITSEIVREKPVELEIYSDLPGHCINGTTIPQDILIASGTGSRPDLVILDRVKKKIQEVTLTCPLEDNIHNANTRKLEKYKSNYEPRSRIQWFHCKLETETKCY